MDEIEFRRSRDGSWELRSQQRLPGTPEQLFPFFSDAGNLERLTPAELRFEIVTPVPIQMREGTLIDYRLRLNGIPMRWRTRIARWEPPVLFVDEQLRGPYAIWVHTHHFTADGSDTIMEDRVRFRLPFGIAGGLAAPIVRRQLRQIFGYRRAVLPGLLRGNPS